MTEPETAERLVDVLKEIRDELRAVRIELSSGVAGANGVRTEMVNRGRWRVPAIVAGGVAGLALVIGLAMRDRPERSTVAAAPRVSAPAASSTLSPAVIPPPAPAVPSASMAAHVAAPVARPPVAISPPAPATKQAPRLPSGALAAAPIAAAPAAAHKRPPSVLAAKPPVEASPDDDATMTFSPPPRRVRVHRLSYGPVESEPAKL
jgi:hypothetical protein